MKIRRRIWAASAAVGMAVASYAAYVGATWLRYGHPARPSRDESDSLLDRFMPKYDVVERHHLNVAAPAEVTYSALMAVDLRDSLVIRTIFKAREVLLGADADNGGRESTLIETTKALGWVVLAEVPGQEIIMGAVTKPWMADVVFRGVPAEKFAAFDEPDYVKIVWTLRADTAGANASVARTETRAVATDAGSRSKFRWYWARFSPGIVLIREIAQRLVKKDAERRVSVHPGKGSSIEIVVPPSGRPSM